MNDTNKERAEFEAHYFAENGNRLYCESQWRGWKARAAKAPAAPTQAKQRDELFQASIDFIGTLTGMTPPPIEVAPPEVFAPFYAFVEKVQAITGAAPPAPTEQQIGALQAELAGNEAATMHLSRMVDELRALLCQAMRVMKDLHESATPDESREDCPPIIPTSDFAKFVNDNAALMYAIKQCGHDAAPPQGAAKGDGNG